jgi:hypothetical protein
MTTRYFSIAVFTLLLAVAVTPVTALAGATLRPCGTPCDYGDPIRNLDQSQCEARCATPGDLPGERDFRRGDVATRDRSQCRPRFV